MVDKRSLSQKCFGSYFYPQEKYTSPSFNANIRFKVKVFVNSHIFIKNFISITPVSLYLQNTNHTSIYNGNAVY